MNSSFSTSPSPSNEKKEEQTRSDDEKDENSEDSDDDFDDVTGYRILSAADEIRVEFGVARVGYDIGLVEHRQTFVD